MNNKVTAIIPKDTQGVLQLSEVLKNSTAIPRAYVINPKNIPVAILHGLEIGLTPLQALSSIAVINGTPVIYGIAPLALVKRSGQLEYLKEKIEKVDNVLTAICEVKRKNEEYLYISSFSMEDAVTAELLVSKDGKEHTAWKKYPKRMLQMRARSTCLKDAFPDVLVGIAMEGEAEVEQEVNVVEVPLPNIESLSKPTLSTMSYHIVAYTEDIEAIRSALGNNNLTYFLMDKIKDSEKYLFQMCAESLLIFLLYPYKDNNITMKDNQKEILRWSTDNPKYSKYYKSDKGNSWEDILKEIKVRFTFLSGTE